MGQVLTILNKVTPFATKLLSVHLFIIITPHYMFRPTGRPSSGAIWQYYIKVKLLNIYSVDPLSHDIHGSNAVENTIYKVYNTLKWVQVHSKIPIKTNKLRKLKIVLKNVIVKKGFLRVLQFPLPIITPTAPRSSYIIWGRYNRPVEADLPTGLSLTAPQEKNKGFVCIRFKVLRRVTTECDSTLTCCLHLSGYLLFALTTHQWVSVSHPTQ
jgi:hypothetical protein